MKQARVGMTLDEFKRAALESIRGNARAEHAIWYLNIKKFRFINESYGYEFGDLILKEFENYLVQRISSRGICANLGDDRFVVCVSQGSYESDAASAAFEELYREMNLLLASHGLEQAVDIAAGVYFLTPEDVEARDIDYLIDQANAAHRRAREQGGSHVIFFDYAYAEKIRRANMIEVDLGNAIAAGEIEVWMQPLLDFVKGEVVAAEALARWNHAKLGRISPAEFIPVLESAGKIGQLTQTREELNRRLGEITKELEDLAYPEMVGWTLVHRLYGEGIVEQQNDAVLTIRYGDTERRQKLPAVLTGGTASTDNTDAMEMCARVESLEKERTSIESKLKLNWHGLDALLNPQPHSRRSRV